MTDLAEVDRLRGVVRDAAAIIASASVVLRYVGVLDTAEKRALNGDMADTFLMKASAVLAAAVDAEQATA